MLVCALVAASFGVSESDPASATTHSNIELGSPVEAEWTLPGRDIGLYGLSNPDGTVVGCLDETSVQGSLVLTPYLFPAVGTDAIRVDLGPAHGCNYGSHPRSPAAVDGTGAFFIPTINWENNLGGIARIAKDGSVDWQKDYQPTGAFWESVVGGDGKLYAYGNPGHTTGTLLQIDPESGEVLDTIAEPPGFGTSGAAHLEPSTSSVNALGVSQVWFLDSEGQADAYPVGFSFGAGGFNRADEALVLSPEQAPCQAELVRVNNVGEQRVSPVTAPYDSCNFTDFDLRPSGGVLAVHNDDSYSDVWFAWLDEAGSVAAEQEFVSHQTDFITLTDDSVVFKRDELDCSIGSCVTRHQIVEMAPLGEPVATDVLPPDYDGFITGERLIVSNGVATLAYVTRHEDDSRTVGVKNLQLTSTSADWEYRTNYFTKVGGAQPPPPPAACVHGEVVVLSARGTGEDNGHFDDNNQPITDSPGRYGYAYASELDARISDAADVRLVGINYPAVLGTYALSVRAGVDETIRQLTDIAEDCADHLPAVVLLGFSQGANVMQEVLEEIEGNSNLGSLPTVIGLFANPMFTWTDEAARGTFNHSATGIAGLPLLGTLHTAAVPASYREITRTWCLYGDAVCDSSKNNLSRAFESKVHTGEAYGVQGHGTDAVFNGQHAMADVLSTSLRELEKLGFNVELGPASLIGIPMAEELDRSSDFSKETKERTYRSRVFWNAGNIVNDAGAVFAYLWDLNGDGVVEQAGSQPTLEALYSITVQPGDKDTQVTGTVEVVGTGIAQTYNLCLDVKHARVCP